MLGCVVSLTSSHLSGSTIRDVNTVGSVLCSNSSFSSLLSSPNPDPTDNTNPSITLPDGSAGVYVDGDPYSYSDADGGSGSSISFSNCRFTHSNYQSVRPLTFNNYLGSISIFSCLFEDVTGPSPKQGGAVSIQQDTAGGPITVNASNFPIVKNSNNGGGMSVTTRSSATIVHCSFVQCGPSASGSSDLTGGGLILGSTDTSSLFTVSNLVFESCHAISFGGGMSFDPRGSASLSDCRFTDCSADWNTVGAGALQLTLVSTSTISVTRLDFIDCACMSNGGGMSLDAKCDVSLSDLHFLRCTCEDEFSFTIGGGLYCKLEPTGILTLNECSFVGCSSTALGGAFDVDGFGHCEIVDCLVQDCVSGTSGTTSFRQRNTHPSSISLTRVAFVNNSIGSNPQYFDAEGLPTETETFVDLAVNYQRCETKPSFSIDDCYSTCGTDNVGMHIAVGPYASTSYDRHFDDAFENFGPVLAEKVGVELNYETRKIELEMKATVPTQSQKVEVTVQKEGNTTDIVGEIELLNGKGTLTSASLNLEFSTKYTITSIVGIVPSSSSSTVSNGITIPEAEWTFRLARTPTFLTFSTPEHPPILKDATSHLIKADGRTAVIFLHFDKAVEGSFDIVVEEGGKDVRITVEMNESAKTGESAEIVVVGDGKVLTHDTSYTIKSFAPTPLKEANTTPAWMIETISFDIPKSSYNPKKSMSPEMKALLSWLIPLVVSLLVAGVVTVIIIVLCRRRLKKKTAEPAQKEMESQESVEVEKMEAIDGGHTNEIVGAEGMSHSAFVSSSGHSTEVNNTENKAKNVLQDSVEVMECDGDFKISSARMNDTLYNVIHKDRGEFGKRAIGIQIVNGLKHVVTTRGRSDLLTRLSSHWILLNKDGSVQLKLQLTPEEAEQEAARMQQEPQPNLEGTPVDSQNRMDNQVENSKAAMDGLRWRAPEVVAAEGGNGGAAIDGHKAAVFSLGLVLWEIETGQVPFGELDAVNAQRQSGTGVGPKMDTLKNEEFVSLIHRCLSVDPKQRPTLSEVGDFLSSHPEESHFVSKGDVSQYDL
ncbi:hypothetical protein BLNAU_2021 [Blattamonas nauphoetae]|uniref:Protein kinase domain-containing protein n=1 Tax=Blattamonas nauphoetae TaxID=2049346 RepID=A0ABQ9YGW2_9EUKA|nr:hypothetical protein BLNAU_2021 [Blattamonas nauphoetae]